MELTIRSPFKTLPEYLHIGTFSSDAEAKIALEFSEVLAEKALKKASKHWVMSITPYLQKQYRKGDPVYSTEEDEYGHEYVIVEGTRISLTNFSKTKLGDRILLYDKQDVFFGYLNKKL